MEGGSLAKPSVRALVVDDHDPWCRHVCSVLKTQPGLQVIGEVSDGLEAVQKAQEVQPDLILLDIGLPTLNGIEAARRIRELSPQSKILFITQETSADVVQVALATGARGYVVKTDAGGELLTALEAVLQGEMYVSTRFAERGLTAVSDPAGFPLRSVREQGHVVQFYTDDAVLLDGLGALLGATLDADESVVAVMTKLHRTGLEKRLIAQGIDTCEAMKNGRLAIFDADQALGQFMDAVGPSRERFLLQFGNIVRRAEAASLVKSRPVVVFGEMVAVLWAQKKYDAAIRLEELWNELSLTCSFYLCCAYPASGFGGTPRGGPYAAICARHSEVVSAF
jgi:DNA-binding NarL/FixJ family response regulator